MAVEISSVVPRSSAARAGIRAGDFLTAVNGHPVRDVLDYRFYLVDTKLRMDLLRNGRPLRRLLFKKEYADPGLEFDTYLMDRPRSCGNHCVFCFVDQLPGGMRDPLYFKDDDSRMSFLFGSYITLTNMTEEDVRRIIGLRLSPVNISVHTTNPELRILMMRNPRSGEVLRYIPMLTEAGIRVNAQIVLCPGINDGAELGRSLEDLGSRTPNLQSIALVPVGLTGHRENLFPLRSVTPGEARAVIETADRFGEIMLARHGSRIAFCADELYLLAGRPIPGPAYYEDYSQLENGVGTTALLREEFAAAVRRAAPDAGSSHIAIATGAAAAPLLRALLRTAAAVRPRRAVTVYPIPSRTFGGGVTVTGLVTGRDLLEQLRGKPLFDGLVIPDVMLRDEGDRFLDDRTPEDLRAAFGVPVHVVRTSGEALFSALSGDFS